MKKLLIAVPLMAAGFAATGCGPQGRHSLTIALDSDTIVLPKPDTIEPELIPVVADSDSLPKVLREDSLMKAAQRARRRMMPPPPPDGQRPPQRMDGHNPPPPPPDGQRSEPPQGPPPEHQNGHNPPPPPSL